MENFGQYNGSQNASSPENYKLKWHKFLIYFALWAGAIMNTGNAVLCIQGTQYAERSEQVYALFPSLRTVDLFWGIVLLAMAAYMIYVRFQLAGFRINAPRKLSTLYIISLAASVLYLLSVSAVKHQELSSFISDIVAPIFSSILMLFINQNYYNKRLELFVN